MLQYLIVSLIVAAAVFYLTRKIVKSSSNKFGGCSGCSGCTMADKCKQSKKTAE